MRVAFLTHCAPLHGANRSLLNLITGLRNHGVESFVVAARDGEIMHALKQLGVPAAVIPFREWMAHDASLRMRAGRLGKNLAVLGLVRRQFRAWNIDVVHSNSSVIPIGAIVARQLRRPHVWHLREFGDLDFGFACDWGECLFRRVIRWADAHIAISEAIRDHYTKRAHLPNVHVIYNGIATTLEFDRLHDKIPPPRFPAGALRFAIVGVVHPAKAQATAIRALALVTARYPGTGLVIAGLGNNAYTESCRALATELGLTEKVEFRGYVANPFEVYQQADAILMCSHHEAMGRVTAEAMAARRPVIGFASGGTTELIVPGQTGLLYDGDYKQLAACMIRFIENPDWARHLGEHGWQVARERFNSETCAAKTCAVLDAVLRN